MRNTPRLGLDELMIVNPRALGLGRFVRLGRIRHGAPIIQHVGRSATVARGLGHVFLGADGIVYRVQALGPARLGGCGCGCSYCGCRRRCAGWRG